jgi:hypothetical protein
MVEGDQGLRRQSGIALRLAVGLSHLLCKDLQKAAFHRQILT